jgi:hypothetical protein
VGKKDVDTLAQASVCHFAYYSVTFQSNIAPNSIMQALGSALRSGLKTT